MTITFLHALLYYQVTSTIATPQINNQATMQDKPLSGERITEERAFIKRYTESLAGYTVQYPADFSAPLHERPRKVPAIAIPVADPPSADAMDVDAPSQGKFP